jgi:hypothetical protein
MEKLKSRHTGVTNIKKARAANSNVSALNALRESIELNEKLRDERKKKKMKEKQNDPNWVKKLNFSDSSDNNSPKRISSKNSSSSGSSSESSSSSVSNESEYKHKVKQQNANEIKLNKALASTGKGDRINDELNAKQSKISTLMSKQNRQLSSKSEGKGIMGLSKFLKNSKQADKTEAKNIGPAVLVSQLSEEDSKRPVQKQATIKSKYFNSLLIAMIICF